MNDWIQDWRFLAAAGGIIAQAAITWQRVNALEKRVAPLEDWRHNQDRVCGAAESERREIRSRLEYLEGGKR